MPLPRIRDAFAADESSPRWPVLAAVACAVLGGLSIAWLAATRDETIVDLGEGLTWRP